MGRLVIPIACNIPGVCSPTNGIPRVVVEAVKNLVKGAGVGREHRLRGDLIPTVGAAVWLLKPLLDAVVAEDVFAVGEAKRGFIDALRVRDAEFVVADDTGSLALVKSADVDALELPNGLSGCDALVGQLTSDHLLSSDTHLLIASVESHVAGRDLFKEAQCVALRLHHVRRILVAIVVRRWVTSSQPHPGRIIAATIGVGGNRRIRSRVAFGVGGRGWSGGVPGGLLATK
jgi:hypothetical protein